MNARTHLVRLVLTSALSFTLVSTAAAQDVPRLEVGGLFSALHLSDLGTTPPGFGGRVSYDVTNWMAVEGELSFFGDDSFEIAFPGTPASALTYSRRRFDGFFGPKIGLRGERFGVFGKVRPGFARLFDRGVDCAGAVCPLALIARPDYRTEFALDLGGVLEFYPTPRTVTRLDIGSALIRHRSAAPPCSGCTTGNFSSSIGAGFRF